jgi:hypothetical protein
MPATELDGTIAVPESFHDEEAEMNEKQQLTNAEVGDLIVIRGHRLGEPERMGEILDVSGEPARVRYRVRWDDGHESMLSPGSDAVIRHASAR